jgi:hypothetical protein
MPLIDTCEVRLKESWETIGIKDGLLRRGEDMRCEECHGRLIPHKKYSTGARAHFEHHTAHSGCSTKEKTFDNNPKLHPDPLT